MKRTHAVAFMEKMLLNDFKECEDIVFSFLSIRDLCKSVATVSKRMKAIAYSKKHWEKIKMLGVETKSTEHFSDSRAKNI